MCADIMIRNFLHEPLLMESTGDNVQKALEHFLFKIVPECDRPFSKDYFLALMGHSFIEGKTVAFQFRRIFVDTRRKHFTNLGEMLTKDIFRCETRRSCSRYLPGKNGVLLQSNDPEASFYLRLNYPTPLEHTFNQMCNNDDSGIAGILMERLDANNVM